MDKINRNKTEHTTCTKHDNIMSSEDQLSINNIDKETIMKLIEKLPDRDSDSSHKANIKTNTSRTIPLFISDERLSSFNNTDFYVNSYHWFLLSSEHSNFDKLTALLVMIIQIFMSFITLYSSTNSSSISMRKEENPEYVRQRSPCTHTIHDPGEPITSGECITIGDYKVVDGVTYSDDFICLMSKRESIALLVCSVAVMSVFFMGPVIESLRALKKGNKRLKFVGLVNLVISVTLTLSGNLLLIKAGKEGSVGDMLTMPIGLLAIDQIDEKLMEFRSNNGKITTLMVITLVPATMYATFEFAIRVIEESTASKICE